jgi:hypothetical protein
MTRNVLKQQAMETAQQCLFGDFIAVEVFNHHEASFMIGMVVGPMAQLHSSVDNWAGPIQKNATVIEVQRLQPASPGSVFFFLTEENLLIDVEHIISGKLDLGTGNTTNSRVSTKYKLDSEQHNLIL